MVSWLKKLFVSLRENHFTVCSLCQGYNLICSKSAKKDLVWNLNPLVLFPVKVVKQSGFPRVVTNSNTLEMSIFSEMRGMNCETLATQTLKSSLNWLARALTLASTHTHTYMFATTQMHTRIDTHKTHMHTGCNTRLPGYSSKACIKPHGKLQM